MHWPRRYLYSYFFLDKALSRSPSVRIIIAGTNRYETKISNKTADHTGNFETRFIYRIFARTYSRRGNLVVSREFEFLRFDFASRSSMWAFTCVHIHIRCVEEPCSYTCIVAASKNERDVRTAECRTFRCKNANEQIAPRNWDGSPMPRNIDVSSRDNGLSLSGNSASGAHAPSSKSVKNKNRRYDFIRFLIVTLDITEDQ